MKKQIITTLGTLLLSTALQAATLLPMNYSEKSAYQITGLVKKGTIDKSFLLDLNKVSISVTAAGALVKLSSASLVDTDPNTVELTFSAAGKVTDVKTHFTNVDPTKTIFAKANSDVILDLGSETVVDFQKDNADIAFTAAHAQEINFTQNGNIEMNIKNDDGRTYQVVMDQDGKVIKKGML